MSRSPRRVLALVIASTLVAISLVTATTVTLLYRHYDANLNVQDVTKELGTDRPKPTRVKGPQGPINILVLGSDDRDAPGNHIDNLTGIGKRSDTTILLHLSADRHHAYGVSIPRDSVVDRPVCFGQDGKPISAAATSVLWNDAFNVGGAGCTQRQLEQLTGIRRAGLVMATPANLAVLAEAGLSDAAADGPGPNDLVVAVAALDDDAAEHALTTAATLLAAGTGDADGPQEVRTAQTLDEGLAELPDANLVLVSTPGTYATAEALRALKRGLNVFLFSDNVGIEDEIMLKELADRKGLLVMGPDCGTAIVGGVPLGFANAVRRGPIGLVGASGTGLQQVTSLIHRFGSGVSQAFGTGGRDLDERVGGTTMHAATRRLLADPATSVIVLISKPPSALVALGILDEIRTSPKPVVVNFLGGDARAVEAAGATFAPTFEAAARLAVDLAAGNPTVTDAADLVGALRDERMLALAEDAASRLAPGQREIRGLYSGGSLAGEAKVVLKAVLGAERHDRILDLGDDEYTVGRPHPMIDPRLRNEHIVATAAEPSVGILLLDVVLGHGSHPDPAEALAPAIADAMALAISAGRHLLVVASVCGTDLDPQGLERQERILAQTGVMLESSNARAAMLAASIAAASARGAADEPLVGAADG